MVDEEEEETRRKCKNRETRWSKEKCRERKIMNKR